MYKEKSRYENLQHGAFIGEGKYNIPKLTGSRRTNFAGLTDFNSAVAAKDTAGKGLHFFIDDYRFVRVWNDPPKYLNTLKKFDFVLTPDFSLYTDFPAAMQIYNHYCKHWLGAYWEENGIEVIPTICWSTEKSFEWCFDGEPHGGTVAVSSVGTQNDDRAKENFIAGYNEMMRRLSPETVIFYGKVPTECKGNILKIDPFYEKFNKCIIAEC